MTQTINGLRDKLAATTLLLEQKEQEVEELLREIDDHQSELDRVAGEWREELEDARAQVSELQDVSPLIYLKSWRPGRNAC